MFIFDICVLVLIFFFKIKQHRFSLEHVSFLIVVRRCENRFSLFGYLFENEKLDFQFYILDVFEDENIDFHFSIHFGYLFEDENSYELPRARSFIQNIKGKLCRQFPRSFIQNIKGKLCR